MSATWAARRNAGLEVEGRSFATEMEATAWCAAGDPSYEVATTGTDTRPGAPGDRSPGHP
jgi:hypothetical protein